MLATTLHQRGYQVIGTSRQPERYAAAVPFTLLPLDLDDAQSVANLPALLFSKVDHLGHNAVAARKNTIHDYDTYRRKADAAFLNDLVAHGPVMDPARAYRVSQYRIADDQDIAALTAQDPLVRNGVGHYVHHAMLHLASRA